MRRLGIIAGAGQFPYLVAQEAKKQGYYVLVCPVIGHATENFSTVADAIAPIHVAKLQNSINVLHTHKVEYLCAAGAIQKNKAFSSFPDFRMARVVFSSLAKGDDALLRRILQEIESEGFTILQPAEFVPSLRMPLGVLTKKQLTPDIITDIEYALPISMAIGALDIGQSIVVKNGMVVAVEALEGTDATLMRAGELCKEGCIAVKTKKIQQDTRIDLPSIGKKTIEILVRYNYTALIVEANSTLFFSMDESIALANKHGIVIAGIDTKQGVHI